MKTHQEILAITSLVMRINELKGDFAISVDIHQCGLRFIQFDCDNQIERMECLYEFEEAYLPRLRKLRHDLEKIGQEALVQRRERAA
ncbi:MAG: hypothetical protein ACPHQ9_13010 [Marinobacter sp.]|uniref:hypothetical protein n=1 Tax=Marinobacter sp. TaxID=50741 RepID=UPI003C556DE8